MPNSRALLLFSAALLLELLPLATAHGDEPKTMDMAEPTPAPAPLTDSNLPKSYFSLSEKAGLMYTHIFLMTISWAVFLPVGIMFSIARSRWTLPAQFVFLIVNALGLLVGVIYGRSTPDMYPNDSHGKIGWISTWLASGWVILGLVNLYAKHASQKHSGSGVSAASLERYSRLHLDESTDAARWSGDSGQGTERSSISLAGDSPSPSTESERTLHDAHYHHDEDEDEADDEKRGFLRDTAVDRFLIRNIPKLAVGRTLKVTRFFYVLFDRTLLLLGFVAFATGTVVYGGIGRGGAVFNVLAHYIKGAIFFWYGLLTLGRWMGMFADFGWAWNVKPPKEIVGRGRAAIPTAEFTESFVIFLYGISNVFLEHLAAWGDAWTAQDLEHVAISVMFFGGGLLGMLIESKKIRNLLTTSILGIKESLSHADAASERWEAPRPWRAPLNPMPAVVILLLGLMMGGHHQSSMLSSMVHKQWGTLFVGFALARAVTYILLYLAPPTSYLPSRPPSEIVTSFCLISGGITFVVSNKDTIAALESYDLDAMFTFIITVGGTGLIMAWAVFVCAIKGWAIRREQGSKQPSSTKPQYESFVGQTSHHGAAMA